MVFGGFALLGAAQVHSPWDRYSRYELFGAPTKVLWSSFLVLMGRAFVVKSAPWWSATMGRDAIAAAPLVEFLLLHVPITVTVTRGRHSPNFLLSYIACGFWFGLLYLWRGYKIEIVRARLPSSAQQLRTHDIEQLFAAGYSLGFVALLAMLDGRFGGMGCDIFVLAGSLAAERWLWYAKLCVQAIRSLHTQRTTQSHSMLAPFFNVLPTDLQLLVLQSWLGNHDAAQLLTSSALDIACCNHSLRETFLSLMYHPAFQWSKHDVDHFVSKHLTAFLVWLHSRKVRMKSLFITNDNISLFVGARYTLPSVECLILWKLSPGKEAAINALLGVCPNVTSISSTLLNDFTSCQPLLLPRLCSLNCAALDLNLAFGNHPFREPAVGLDGLHLSRFFGRFTTGIQHLQVIVIHNSKLIDSTMEVISDCKQLQRIVLTVTTCRLTSAGIIRFVASCRNLTELSLPLFSGDIDAILQACRHHPKLRSFSVHDERSYHDEGLYELLEAHPGLTIYRLGSVISGVPQELSNW